MIPIIKQFQYSKQVSNNVSKNIINLKVLSCSIEVIRKVKMIGNVQYNFELHIEITFTLTLRESL